MATQTLIAIRLTAQYGNSDPAQPSSESSQDSASGVAAQVVRELKDKDGNVKRGRVKHNRSQNPVKPIPPAQLKYQFTYQETIDELVHIFNGLEKRAPILENENIIRVEREKVLHLKQCGESILAEGKYFFILATQKDYFPYVRVSPSHIMLHPTIVKVLNINKTQNKTALEAYIRKWHSYGMPQIMPDHPVSKKLVWKSSARERPVSERQRSLRSNAPKSLDPPAKRLPSQPARHDSPEDDPSSASGSESSSEEESGQGGTLRKRKRDPAPKKDKPFEKLFIGKEIVDKCMRFLAKFNPAVFKDVPIHYVKCVVSRLRNSNPNEKPIIMEFMMQPFDFQVSKTSPHLTQDEKKIMGRYPLIINQATYDIMSPLFRGLYTEAPQEFMDLVGFKQPIFIFSDREATILPLSFDYSEADLHSDAILKEFRDNKREEVVCGEEAGFLEHVTQIWPMEKEFNQLDPEIKQEVREFFFREHDSGDTDFMHVQARNYRSGYYRKGFHCHALMELLNDMIDDSDNEHFNSIASLYGHSERMNRNHWLLRALPLNDEWQLADASEEDESGEESSSAESDDERPAKAAPPAKTAPAALPSAPSAKAAAPAAPPANSAPAALPAAPPANSAPAALSAHPLLTETIPNENGFCYVRFGKTTGGGQHHPVKGRDTAFSYENTIYTKDEIGTMFENPEKEANFERLWQIISQLVLAKTEHFMGYKGTVQFRSFPSGVESTFEHIPNVLGGCQFQAEDWVFVLGRNTEIMPVLYAVHIDKKSESTVYFLDPLLDLAGNYHAMRRTAGEIHNYVLKQKQIDAGAVHEIVKRSPCKHYKAISAPPMSIFYIFYAVELCIENKNPNIVLEINADRIPLFLRQIFHFVWGRHLKASTTARPALPVLTLCVAGIQAIGQTPGRARAGGGRQAPRLKKQKPRPTGRAGPFGSQ